MQRKKLIPIVLSAVTSFISVRIEAAKVEYIDPKLTFIIVDQGMIHGVSPGANICVLDEQKFIISCGGVVLVNRTKAALRLPIEEAKRIRLGSEISIKEIYLKDDAAPGPGSMGLPVFRPARVRPAALPPTISSAASAKEDELSAGYEGPPPQPSYVDPLPNQGASSDAISGPIVEQNAEDPYSEIDRLSDIVKLPDNKKDMSNLTWKELRERIVFRAFTVEAQALYPLSQPATYKAPAFSTIPDTNPTRSTIWNASTVTKKPASGISLQLSFMNPREINYNFGWRYYQKVSTTIDSSLDARFPRLFAHSSTVAESMGLWGQRLWRFKPNSLLFTDLGLGADFNVSDVAFKSNYDSIDPSQDPLASGLIANARSRLASMSIRGSIAQVLKFYRFNISLALAVYKPVYLIDNTFDANTKVPSGATISSDEMDDVKNAIDHKQNRLAADIHFGIGGQF